MAGNRKLCPRQVPQKGIMEESKREGQLRRPFTDIQNVQNSDQVSIAITKGCIKPPLSNKAKAIELGRQTLAAYKERR